MEQAYIQKIIFGSPGTGKSHMITNTIIPNILGVKYDENGNSANVVKAVFHPEYTYGDFMGKLLPMTKDGDVQYNFYEGHFLKALAQAYKNILKADEKSEAENVVLVIDEINRGNSSAIFGSVFQLLDREEDGWSSYSTNINGVMFNRLLELIGFEYNFNSKGEMTKVTITDTDYSGRNLKEINEKIKFLRFHLVDKTITIPPNLSIIATMNTSDSSIFHMDTAFKRRWDWVFIDIESNPVEEDGNAFESETDWFNFIRKLNLFIKSNSGAIRGIEDKQIGKYFIKTKNNKISFATIQSKLMFFIWDSVFTRDKKPLLKLLRAEDRPNELVTFGDFAVKVKDFVQAIKEYKGNV